MLSFRPKAAKRARRRRTLVLKEVTHARSPRKDELRDVLDDLRLGLLGHRGVPFREADLPYRVPALSFQLIGCGLQAHLGGRREACN